MTPQQRARALAGQLVGGGHLTPEWLPAFVGVRRDLFLPDRVWLRDDTGPYRALDRATDPDGWWQAAYSDRPVVTQVEDGADAETSNEPSSSASMPRVVARMPHQLAVEPGMTVLEIGTGTGYNAALLAHRLGGGHVTSVDIDPAVLEGARRAFNGARRAPHLAIADGAQGYPDRAPYDRIIATCAVHSIPRPWITQTRPGGIIVTPLGTAMVNGVMLKLTVRNDGTAVGRIVDDAAFMWLRSQRIPRSTPAPRPEPAVDSSTKTDPRALGDSDALLAVGLQVPGCRYTVGHGPDGEFTLWFSDGTSWASVDYEPGAEVYAVQQYGPRTLWDEIEKALDWWTAAGEPERTRLGIVVDDRRQWAFLDSPDRPLPGGSWSG
ncbi:methyltransferase domain-containing protein [Streptacidiphilus sp. PB12-B1b]|uniref:methyltransferase domain-containing protein n=1 Tax=Streptacidiphilus sp. PB12-B1b TaxID=2705012 RepID=UPI0015FDAB88|nr:methyltransferase domain-containing protein [Streptacidiphilus sp. PB12-B1b]QMU76838.1 methyltransferase domain-containing protein [Streptacidiphilus sp. PB12-B1b]